jgi:hypothetical protein
MGISLVPLFSDNVVEFKTSQIAALRKLFDTIRVRLPDVNILFNSTDVQIMQMDIISNSFIVDVTMRGDSFDHYYCAQTDNNYIPLSLSCDTMYKIFKDITKDHDTLTFTYDLKNGKVTLSFVSESRGEALCCVVDPQEYSNTTHHYSLAGKVDYEYHITIPASGLANICRVLKTQECENLTLEFDGDRLAFINKGKTPGSVKTTIERWCSSVSNGKSGGADHGIQVLKRPENALFVNQFRFNLIQEFSKGYSGDQVIAMYLSCNTENPIIMEYPLGTLGETSVAISPLMDQSDTFL